MRKSNEARGNKRRFGSGKGASHQNARRGPPAIFITCEGGREKKAQREALELIHHYYYASRPSSQKETNGEETAPAAAAEASTDVRPSEEQPLSLEEELAMLRKGAAAEEVLSFEPDSKRPRNASDSSKKMISSMKSPFSIYDTGTRGIVCILFTTPGCEMVPYDDILAEIRASKEKDDSKTAEGGTGNADSSKSDDNGKSTVDQKEYVPKVTVDNENQTSQPQEVKDPPLWDPVDTVKCIMRDAKKSGVNNDEKKDSEEEQGGEKEASESKAITASPPPGSRFILRILPMQATCYASVEEIKAVSKSLLKRFLPKFQTILSKESKEITFKLEIKRRLCTHLTRDDVIGALTPLVYGGLDELPGYKYKVNLSDPDFSIRIETCKSLCGITILPRDEWSKNFNLAELNNPTADGKAGKAVPKVESEPAKDQPVPP